MAVSLRYSWWTVVLVLAVGGCAPKKSTRRAADPEASSPALNAPRSGEEAPAPSQPVASTTPGTPTGPAAEPAAVAFLQAVGEGNAKPDVVTPTFLKIIAEPGILQSDIARGYDEYGVRQWFGTAAGAKYGAPLTKAESGDAAIFAGPLTGNPNGRYALRLLRTSGNWKVDWFQRLPANAPAPAAENAFAAVAADCALAAILSAQDDSTRFAVALLSPDLRRRFGPPFPSDEKRGYNAGALRAKLNELSAGATGYTLTSAGNDTYRAELTGGKKQTLTLKLVKGPNAGQWLVDDIRAE